MYDKRVISTLSDLHSLVCSPDVGNFGMFGEFVALRTTHRHVYRGEKDIPDICSILRSFPPTTLDTSQALEKTSLLLSLADLYFSSNPVVSGIILEHVHGYVSDPVITCIVSIRQLQRAYQENDFSHFSAVSSRISEWLRTLVDASHQYASHPRYKAMILMQIHSLLSVVAGFCIWGIRGSEEARVYFSTFRAELQKGTHDTEVQQIITSNQLYARWLLTMYGDGDVWSFHSDDDIFFHITKREQIREQIVRLRRDISRGTIASETELSVRIADIYTVSSEDISHNSEVLGHIAYTQGLWQQSHGQSDRAYGSFLQALELFEEEKNSFFMIETLLVLTSNDMKAGMREYWFYRAADIVIHIMGTNVSTILASRLGQLLLRTFCCRIFEDEYHRLYDGDRSPDDIIMQGIITRAQCRELLDARDGVEKIESDLRAADSTHDPTKRVYQCLEMVVGHCRIALIDGTGKVLLRRGFSEEDIVELCEKYPCTSSWQIHEGTLDDVLTGKFFSGRIAYSQIGTCRIYMDRGPKRRTKFTESELTRAGHVARWYIEIETSREHMLMLTEYQHALNSHRSTPSNTDMPLYSDRLASLGHEWITEVPVFLRRCREEGPWAYDPPSIYEQAAHMYDRMWIVAPTKDVFARACVLALAVQDGSSIGDILPTRRASSVAASLLLTRYECIWGGGIPYGTAVWHTSPEHRIANTLIIVWTLARVYPPDAIIRILTVWSQRGFLDTAIVSLLCPIAALSIPEKTGVTIENNSIRNEAHTTNRLKRLQDIGQHIQTITDLRWQHANLDRDDPMVRRITQMIEQEHKNLINVARIRFRALLTRHGRTASDGQSKPGTDDEPLIETASSLSKRARLQGIGNMKIRTSPLSRAVSTAMLIAQGEEASKVCPPHVHSVHALRNFDKTRPTGWKLGGLFSIIFPPSMGELGKCILDTVLSASRDSTTLFVTHADVCKAIDWIIASFGREPIMRTIHMGNDTILELCLSGGQKIEQWFLFSLDRWREQLIHMENILCAIGYTPSWISNPNDPDLFECEDETLDVIESLDGASRTKVTALWDITLMGCTLDVALDRY